MRADRLVALLLLLQSKGSVTAAEAAVELEVSTRTARRDLEALAMSGVPIYSQAGRGGGWTLLGGASTDLTGFTADETRALFLTVGTATTVSPALRSALRKLVQALPEPFRHDADRAADVAIVDDAAWGRERRAEQPEFLEPLQRALVVGHQVRLGYLNPEGRSSNRIAHPLGLVAKSGVWYLIAGTDAGQRTFRVSRITALDPLDEAAERPDDFDLAEAWRAIAVRIQDLVHPMTALGSVAPEALAPMRHALGTILRVGPERPDGRVEIEVQGENEFVLAARLAGFAHSVEIVEPEAVRLELRRLGARLLERYDDRSPSRF